MSRNPKPASTVVLMNHEGKIYMTKRPQTMKVLKGYYVFPGGTVDKGDYLRDPEYLIGSDRVSSTELAYSIAAARELFEEIGILLASPKDRYTPFPNEKTARSYRNQLVKGEITFLEFLKKENLVYSFDSLTYFGTQITPAQNTYRFHTRYYFTDLPRGQTPAPCQYEIAEAFWISPQEALKLSENGSLQMAEPTILALQTIVSFQNRFPKSMSAL